MDPLFAPWRMDWVTREDTNDDFDGCIFCKFRETEADRKHRILARSDHSYVLLNKAPYTPGHLLVLPDSHNPNLRKLEEEALVDLIRLLQKSVIILEDTLYPDGFNIGMNIGEAGGASIGDHLHVHIVPRWQGDTNFMPTTANSKIVPEALDETYERLYESFLETNGVHCESEDQAVFVQ